MPIYRPRMAAILDVPVGIESVTLPLRVRSATLESNDHLHADELHLEAEYGDAAIDPRFIRDANVAFWLGNANDRGDYNAPNDDIRFVGLAHGVERAASESGRTVTLTCRDYTALFLEHKPVRAAGIPRYTDTLADAWHRLCDETGPYVESRDEIVSTVSKLKDRLVFRGNVNQSIQLSHAVAARIARAGGPITVKQGADAWGVWLQCVGMFGLMTYIERDTCVVTTTKDHFADDSKRAPSMVYGSNVLSFKEHAHGAFQAKGTAISSFDPLTGTTLEAFYPPRDDKRIQRARLTAKKKHAGPSLVKAEDYDWQTYPGVTNPDALFAIAKATYEVRARQELEGSLSTAEMRVANVAGGEVDMLSLESGDTFNVQIDREMLNGVFATLSEGERVDYLTERGYSDGAAQLMAKTTAAKMRYGFSFKARKVRTHLEAAKDGGKFSIDVEYWNRIEIEDVVGA